MDDQTPSKRPAPWRGRKRVEDPRTVFVSVRCTPTEHASIMAAAAQSGLSAGPFLRKLAVGEAGKHSRRIPTPRRQNLAKLLAEIGKLGSNINQLARAANSGEIVYPESLDMAMKAVIDCRAEIMIALGREVSADDH